MTKKIQGNEDIKNKSKGNIIDYIKTKNWEYGDGEKPSSVVRELPILKNNINNKKPKMSFTEEYEMLYGKPKSKSNGSGTVELAWDLPSDVEEDTYGKYLELLKGGDLTPGTSFEDFEKNYSNYDAKLLQKKKALDEMRLSNAIQKIDSALSGLSGILNLNSGGPVKNRPREPKIKKLNLADYFKLGMTVAELSPQEREVVNNLLNKTLNPKIREN
jgi:hypothetical protein